jgi:hypothetical protein
MVRAVRDAISEKLGVCPFCMRASARGALAAWALYGVGRAMGPRLAAPPWVWLVLLAAAWAFTLLIAAHLVAYMARRAARLHAMQRMVAREWNGRRLLSRREFVSRVLGAGAGAAAIAVFGHVPAQGGIINCPGKFDMNRTETAPGDTNADAEANFLALADSICDFLCSTKICASGGCIRNSSLPVVTSDKAFGPGVGGGRKCTGTIKQCNCTCGKCAQDHSLNRFVGEDYASGSGLTNAAADAQMMANAREKCDQECGRYRDCSPNPPLNCKRNGDPVMDPNTYKSDAPDPHHAYYYSTQRVKTCRCSCQDAPPAPDVKPPGIDSPIRPKR